MTSFEGEFQVCNKAIRRILNLPLDGPINANIKQFYVNPEERDNAISKLLKHEKDGTGSDKVLLHFRVGERDVFVEDFCKSLRNKQNGEVIGFIGCLVDVTNEIEASKHERELQKRVKELTFDIGRILHTSNTTLLMTDQTLTSIINVLEPNPFDDMPVSASDRLSKILSEKSGFLSSAIEKFMLIADDERRLKSLTKNRWLSLEEDAIFLRSFEKIIPEVELRPSALYKIARNVSEICNEIELGYLPREAIRDLHREAWHLLKVTILYDALKTRDAVLQMEIALQTLREYVTSDIRETKNRVKMKIDNLLNQVIGRLSSYAENSHVKIKIKGKVDEFVYVNEREIVRALTNLLHNSIKYSWHREFPKPAWVLINTFVSNGKVFIEFENWGVPISAEEINDGSIFELGYRGAWSKDRGRLGTGIGLTDAKRVAISHGGDVFVESRPARSKFLKSPDYYDQPFITKATIIIPTAL